MQTFQSALKGTKFTNPNGDEIEFDKIVSVQMTREETRDGPRVYTVAAYDNGKRFESYGKVEKTEVEAEEAAPVQKQVHKK